MRYILPLLLALPLLLWGCSEPSDFLTGSNPRKPEATGSPAPANASSAAVSAGPQRSTSTASASALPPVIPAQDFEKALEAAFKKCEASYLDSLTGRVPDPSITRVPPYQSVEDRIQRRIEYDLLLRSHFIHVDSSSGTDLAGKYVREIAHCRVDYDEKSGLFHSRNEIGIEETTRTGA